MKNTSIPVPPAATAAILAATQGSTTNSPLEAFKHVRLRNGKEFTAVGACGGLQITGRAERLGGDAFDICVPADRIARILGTHHAEFAITLSDKALTVKGSGSRFSLPLYTTGEFPLMSADPAKGSVTVSADVLRAAIARVLPRAADGDVSRPFMTSMIVQKEGTNLWFAATDGAGMAWMKVTCEDATSSFFAYVHQHTCRRLKGLLGRDDVTIALGERITITSGDVTIDASNFDFAPFDWRRVVRERHDATATVLAGTAAETIAEALILAASDKSGPAGELNFGSDGLRVSAGNSEGGGYQGAVPFIVAPAGSLTMGFNLQALQEIFATFPRDAEVRIGMKSANDALTFDSEALPGYQAIYMPRRA